jgi:predicted RNase H-like HicB family nuclease
MTLKAIVHQAKEGGFWAEVPALPGCVTQGETEEEIHRNLLEAVELWFEAGEDATAPDQASKVLELAL